MKQETNITWSNRGFHNYEATYIGERVTSRLPLGTSARRADTMSSF